jgi:hypothetical protein
MEELPEQIYDCINTIENGGDIFKKYQAIYDQRTLITSLPPIVGGRIIVLTLDEITYNGVDLYPHIWGVLSDKIKNAYRIFLAIKLPNNTRIITGDELNEFIYFKNRKFYDKTLKLIQSLRLPIECVINDELRGETIEKPPIFDEELDEGDCYILCGGEDSDRDRFVREKLINFVNMTPRYAGVNSSEPRYAGWGDPFNDTRVSAIKTFVNVSSAETDISKQDLEIAIRQTRVVVLIFTKLDAGKKHVDWKNYFSQLNGFLDLKKIKIYNF